MRVGIVGLGRAGTVHLDAWREVADVEVVAASDPAPEIRQRAETSGLRAYSDLTVMLQHENLDAVSVCTPPADHYSATMSCLEHGLHVLCEKPLALSAQEAVAMFAVAERRRRHLVLATKFRHVPSWTLARALIRGGEIGEALAFDISFCSRVDMSQRWNALQHRAGGGVIIDNGCHAFDLAGFLFGPVTRVHATALKPIQRLPVEDSATVQLEVDGGAIGRIDVSWSLDPCGEVYARIHGSRGAIEIGWSESRVRLDGRGWQSIHDRYDKLIAHRQMLAWFAEMIRQARPGWIERSECLQTVFAVEAAYRSIRSRRWEWVNGRSGRRAGAAWSGSAAKPQLERNRSVAGGLT